MVKVKNIAKTRYVYWIDMMSQRLDMKSGDPAVKDESQGDIHCIDIDMGQ